MIGLLAAAGMRVGEALQLDRGDVAETDAASRRRSCCSHRLFNAMIGSRPNCPVLMFNSRGLPSDALEWADTTASELVRQKFERNCALV